MLDATGVTLSIAGNVQRATLWILPASGGQHVLEVGCILLTAHQAQLRNVQVVAATPEELRTLDLCGFLSAKS